MSLVGGKEGSPPPAGVVSDKDSVISSVWGGGLSEKFVLFVAAVWVTTSVLWYSLNFTISAR